MTVRISYSFDIDARTPSLSGGGQLDNSFFAILVAIRDSGSIGAAAERLGLSYRHVWGYLKKQEAYFGHELLVSEVGKAARLSAFGTRLLWAERCSRARMVPASDMLATRLDNELRLALDPELQRIAIRASHDPLFGPLRDFVLKPAGVLLDIDYVSCTTALESLNRNECPIAGINLPLDNENLCRRGSLIHAELGPYLRLGDHKLIRFAARELGLIVARGNPLAIASVADLTRNALRFVNRRPGSVTRLVLDESLLQHDIVASVMLACQTEEPTHQAVATAVAAGQADCGFGLRAAATQFNLDFVPILHDWYFIVCHKAQLENDGMQAIIAVLRSENFRTLAHTLPGYSADSAGEIISLRRALPWYK